MIQIANIRNVKPNDFDFVFAIVRSMKSKSANIQQMAALSPSWNLFKSYRQLVEMNLWNRQAFNTTYVPTFLYEITNSPEAQKALDYIQSLDQENKRIALVCFCADETLCHRSIVAGLLQARGCNVICETPQNYAQYYAAFFPK